MNNNNDFNNSQNNGWGSTPNNSSDSGQNNTNNFNQPLNNNGWGTNQNDITNNFGANQNNNWGGSDNSTGGFNPNTDYSNNAGFDPNQTYNNNLYTNQGNTGSNANYGYQSTDNQYSYGTPQTNGTTDMYGNTNMPNMPVGEDINKGKAIATLVLGAISCVLSLIGIACFWGAMASACSSNSSSLSSDFAIGMGIILSGAIPFVSLVLGIVGIIVGASYYSKSKQTGVATNKGKATGGIVLNVIAVIFSAISVISCVSCVGCVGCFAEELSDEMYDYDYDDDYDYDYDDFEDYDFDDYL